MKDVCSKCNGFGWVWWNDLNSYSGPASDPYDEYFDDTKYTCDQCGGECYIDTEEGMPEEAPW